jgi:hypothetical protein
MDGVGVIDRFPTVDEMQAFVERLSIAGHERVTVAEIGKSRAGDPIHLVSLEVDAPRASVLVIGQPHPNEPIGMATVVAMVERLATDKTLRESLAVSWHFVPCADPDGTRLNEGWFAGPWTREHYARNFYRPAGEQQVEWTFPFHSDEFSVDRPMPETRALMTAIDRVRPDVAASLHNGELGGAYFYATTGADALYPQLTGLCESYDVPLHRGDPETPLSEVLWPAVYSIPTAAQLYEFAKAAGADPAALVSGGSSYDYATSFLDTFGLAIELPYWRDPRAADTSPDPTGQSRRDVVLHHLDLQEESVRRLQDLLDAADPTPSPCADAVRSFLATDEGGWIEGQRQQAMTADDHDRPVTVAEAFGARDNVHMFRLRLGGMLLRAVDPDSPTHAEVSATFDAWAAEAAADNKAEAIPIRDLVAVQAGAILATARHVARP